MGKRWILAVGAGALLGALAVQAWQGEAAAPAAQPQATVQPQEDPHGAGCVAGCGQAKDGVPALTAEDFEGLLLSYATEPMDAGSEALETLLFHHPSARALLAERGAGSLDPERAAFLEEELSRETAWLDVRVVDEHGVERVRLRPTRVPLGIKQHLHPGERRSLQELEVSGTVRRVGLYHLWTRI